MGWDVRARRATIYDGGAVPYEATNVPQVARAIVKVLEHLEETRNQYVYVSLTPLGLPEGTLVGTNILFRSTASPRPSAPSSPHSKTPSGRNSPSRGRGRRGWKGRRCRN